MQTRRVVTIGISAAVGAAAGLLVGLMIHQQAQPGQLAPAAPRASAARSRGGEVGPPAMGGKPMARTITVGQGPYAGTTNQAIQKALDDAAAAGGGTVIVPAGTYMLHDAVHLRSGVRLVGEKGAILKKVPSVSSPVADYLGYGHYEFTVTEPAKFRVGMGVHLLDDNAGGFYTTVATIIDRKGELFFIDRMLNHDYDPRANARVVSVFPLVEGFGVEDAAVEGLVLDGNYPAETFRLTGCRGGGVFLLGSQRVRVVNVEVRNYHGDAVSFQQCADILVERCRLHHNTGHGLHPGSGSVRYVMRGVRAYDNGGCGIYYCLRTTHSILEDCELLDNAQAGISIGERDTDHLIRRNRVRGNGLAGVLFRQPARRGGNRVLIRDNAIGPNCTEKGDCEILIPAGLRQVWLDANTIDPGKGRAARVEAGCTNVYVTANTIAGSGQRPEDIDAGDEAVTFSAPNDFPPLGPAALPADGAKHLGLTTLPPWSEPQAPAGD